MKKLVLTVGVVSLVAFAALGQSKDRAFLPAEEVIRADVAAQDVGNWDAFLGLRLEAAGTPEDASSYRTQWGQSQIGIRDNVLAARLERITALPFDVARQFVGGSCYVNELRNAKAYYAIIDYTVRTEDKYVVNGPNARLYILDDRGDGWRIMQVSEPPIAALIVDGFALGSPGERVVSRRQETRLATGLFLNDHNEVVYSVASARDRDGLRFGAAPFVTGDHLLPSSITVAHSTNYANGCIYQSLIGCIDFHSYVRNVLPNEWPSSYPSESLKAGAMAAKMYGWYHVYFAKYPNKGYDVLDQDCDQVYRPNSAATNTDNAVNAVAGLGFDRSDGNLFEPHYSAGSYDSSGYHSGSMSQNGTSYLASLGYTYDQMVHYYYDYSSSTGASYAAHFFNYSETTTSCASSLSASVTSPVGG